MRTKRIKESEKDVWCPYCEDELANSQMAYCQPCKVETFNCPKCGKAAPRSKKICPACGASMKPKNI